LAYDTVYIHSLFTDVRVRQEAVYASRAAIAERERGLNLMPREADMAEIRCGWRARGDVTSDFVTARIG